MCTVGQRTSACTTLGGRHTASRSLLVRTVVCGEVEVAYDVHGVRLSRLLLVVRLQYRVQVVGFYRVETDRSADKVSWTHIHCLEVLADGELREGGSTYHTRDSLPSPAFPRIRTALSLSPRMRPLVAQSHADGEWPSKRLRGAGRQTVCERDKQANVQSSSSLTL